MEMKKGVDLLKKAARDFELARKYRDAREYITASILYRKATEKVLRALFMKDTNKAPPKDASIEFLALQTQLPEDVYDDLLAMPDETMEMFEDESLTERDDAEQTHMAQLEERSKALTKHELVKRLIDYANANV